MTTRTKVFLFIAAFVGFVWASPSDSEIARCEGHGHSRETCINALLPS
jgi:hypothetical protein